MSKSMTKSRLIMMGGTLGCALGIGVLMQMTVSDPAPGTGKSVPLQAASVAATPLLPAGSDAPNDGADNADAGNEAEADAAASGLADAVIDGTSAPAETNRDVAANDPKNSAQGVDLGTASLTRADPRMPVAAPQPDVLSDTPVALTVATLDDTPSTETLREDPVPGFACEIEMTARPGPAAVVDLDLSAPCMMNERFTLHHNGLMITGVTDDAGTWQAGIPALSSQALFIVAFPNGEGTIANAEVEALAGYDRYVVQWKGQSGMQIHALEYGADYGEEGHVWYDTARDADTAMRGDGGFLVRLGEPGMDDALHAEVYSFPSGGAHRDGEVKINLETEITQANCGRDIEAQALIKSTDGMLGARDLNLAMPDCNAVGDFLVLKNLYEDLKIARN